MPKSGVMSVKHKLILMQMFTTCLVLFIFSAFLIWQGSGMFYKSILQQHRSQAQLVGLNSVSAIEFLDETAARESLSSLAFDSYVVNAWITDSENKIFADYADPGFESFDFAHDEAGGSIFPDFVIISEDMSIDGVFVGKIHIRLDMAQFKKALMDLIFLTLGLVLLAVVFAFILALFIQRIISSPINELTSMVEKIADTKDLTMRVDTGKQDEIGILSNSMNSMFNQIRELKEGLEERVRDRTAELEKERNRFKNLTAHLPAMIYQARSVPGGGPEFVYVSPNMLQLYEISKDEEKNISAALASRIHPDDTELVAESNRKAIESGEPWYNSHRLVMPSGTVKWIEGASNPTVQADGSTIWDGLILDITDRKQAEKKLILSESRLAEAQRIAHLGNWEWHLETGEVIVSEEVGNIYGRALNDLRCNIDQFLHPIHEEDRDKVMQALQTARDNRASGETDYRVITTLGETRWVHGTFKTKCDRKTGLASRLFGIIEDITEWKEITETLEESRDKLEDANERLRNADRIKSIFLASMSHELRTPLNSIIGFTGILLQGMVGDLNEEQKKQLSMVKSSAQHLLELINEVLDISKIEAGQVELEMSLFDFSKLVKEVLATLKHQAKTKNIELKSDVLPGIQLYSDQRRIKQVLINLINNGIKFTDQGYVSTEVKIKPGQLLHVAISDTGVGIKEKDMVRLFQPFQQVDDSMTKKYEGTGLGLYLSQKIMTLLGGQISASSKYGKGSSFIIDLPVRKDEIHEENSGD